MGSFAKACHTGNLNDLVWEDLEFCHAFYHIRKTLECAPALPDAFDQDLFCSIFGGSHAVPCELLTKIFQLFNDLKPNKANVVFVADVHRFVCSLPALETNQENEFHSMMVEHFQRKHDDLHSVLDAPTLDVNEAKVEEVGGD